MVGCVVSKKKAFLKSPQSRAWTSFIEAGRADGQALTPAIIFKGKELQSQRFLQEFKESANWHFKTSSKGWTDSQIALEWLSAVYLPQTKPADESDARLLILDGHNSHATVSLFQCLKPEVA